MRNDDLCERQSEALSNAAANSDSSDLGPCIPMPIAHGQNNPRNHIHGTLGLAKGVCLRFRDSGFDLGWLLVSRSGVQLRFMEFQDRCCH